MRFLIVCMAMVLTPAWSQEIKFPPSFEKLAAKAVENVNVRLDGTMLQAAGQFLSSERADEKEAKKLVSGLKGIQVRSFEFAKEGEYSDADVAPVRAQLRHQGWAQIVSASSKKDRESAEIYVRREGGRVVGITVLAMEPKELTVVHIDGSIDLEGLSKLGGQFGVPEIDMKIKAPATKK